MNIKCDVYTLWLELFTGLHRSSFIQFQEAAERIAFHLKTEHTRVVYLLDNTQNNDPDLCAATTRICINMNDTRNNFQINVDFILPVYPYLKQRKNSNKNTQISGVNIKSKFQSKMWVDLLWHKKDEHKKLTKEQRAEWYKCQKFKDRRYVTNKQRQSYGKHTKVSDKKKFQANISTLETQLKVV